MAHTPKEPPPAETVRIRGDMIRLGQLLKLTNVVGTGSEVKELLATEQVLVNGEPSPAAAASSIPATSSSPTAAGSRSRPASSERLDIRPNSSDT